MKYFATIGDKQFEVEIKADQQIDVDNQQFLSLIHISEPTRPY